jgi:transketolase
MLNLGYSYAVRETNQSWGVIDQQNVAEARSLALDILEKIGTGHPGATLSLMPLVYLLYSKLLTHDPRNPTWACRDKLILSCGHLSLAQYIQLHFSGYDLSMDDLKAFRTLGSKTPGHPEIHKTPGVETTTGPLGQGFATAVGMALSDAIHDKNSPSQKCNRERQIYVIASDGDIHEGISYEAANIASLYGLKNITVIYDSNGITIDGSTEMNSVLNVEKYFESLNWHVQKVIKGQDGDINAPEVITAIKNAQESKKPSLIVLETIIGWPAPNWQNSSKIHGNVISSDEYQQTKKLLGIDPESKFRLTDVQRFNNIAAITRRSSLHKSQCQNEGPSIFSASQLSSEIKQLNFPDIISTRKANAIIIKKLQEMHPWVIGGSADLTESNSLSLENRFQSGTLGSDPNGTNIIYGVREHAMSAVSNGMALEQTNIIFCATYLVFSDYQKPAIRLAALMNIPTIYMWTHDSVAIGADGPTHQPIDQLAMLRAIPNFAVIRPSSANELKYAWTRMLTERKPYGVVLSRQDLPNLMLDATMEENVSKGGYRVFQTEATTDPDLVIIATGSEVSVAIEASKKLSLQDINVRVVSMLSIEWFIAQDISYKIEVLGSNSTPKITLEAASTFGWSAFTGFTGRSIGIDTFGESGDGSELLKRLGISVESVVNVSLKVLGMSATDLNK